MKGIVFYNARIIDPSVGLDVYGSLITKENKILSIENKIKPEFSEENFDSHDCKKNVLSPGIIDMSVSIGEPGYEHKENIVSATKSAVAGGVTTIISMPDTNPVIDDVPLLDFLLGRAKNFGLINVLPMASLTKNLEGKKMSEIGLLKKSGAIAFTDGYRSIANTNLMRNLFLYTSDFDALICHYLDVAELSESGSMNEGEISTRLGLKGIPKVSESIMLNRDIQLLESLKVGKYHALCISTSESMEIIKEAKTKFLKVTAATSPYHFIFNESEVINYRTFAKIKPPLRSEEDRVQIINGIKNDTIDIITSHHRPETEESKRLPFDQAEFGASGLETLLPATLSLFHNENISLINLLHKLTTAPANLLDLASGRLTSGSPADIMVFDPNRPWLVKSEEFFSKSKNSPFDGRPLQGKVLTTVVSGKIVYNIK